MELGEHPIITVLGQRGTGKTSWVKAHIKTFSRVILWDTLGEYDGAEIVETTGALYEAVESWGDGPGRVIMNCMEENDLPALSYACRLAEAAQNVALIVEEVDAYATPTTIPGDLRRLLKVGRHFGISMVFVSRRPAEINRLITSQSRRFILFRLIEPNDLRYLGSVIGAEAENIKSLPDLHFLDWQHGKINSGRIDFSS